MGGRLALLSPAALAALALLSVTAAPAAAQTLREPRARQGYYIALGAHGAVQHNREDGDGLGVWGGFATSLRLGQLLTPRLGLGIQLDVGGASGDGQSSTVIGLGLGGQLEVARNLAVHAVVGLGVVSLSDPDQDTLRGSYGAAYTLGLTYDWFPAHHRKTGGWAITPGVQLRAIPGDPVTSLEALVGVELSYWSGLPKNQLELPPSEAFGGS